MQIAFSADEIIAIAQPKAVRGSTPATIAGLAALTTARPGDLSFLGNPRYKSEVAGTLASIVLLPVDYPGEPKDGQLFLLVEKPSVALAKVCARIEQQLWPRPSPGVHPTAVVAPDAEVAPSATVGPFCVIGARARIGERTHLEAQVFVGHGVEVGADCWLMPGARVLAECRLADRVRLHPGVVVGSDGFGYEFIGGRHEKVAQVGRVEIESDVEIGANSTVDRARFAVTRIGEGTKIDNLVQIGHNCLIGRHVILCAQVGLAGSTTLEDYVVLGGQAGAAGHLTVGKGAKAGGRAGIVSDIAAGAYVNGNPAISYMLERRIAILQQRLPDLFHRVDALEDQIDALKKTSAT
jgi:UDP-3-O-[3-hydroxymyristoyl] glucosamine N-acyltransferase